MWEKWRFRSMPNRDVEVAQAIRLEEAWPSDGTAKVVAERKPWLANGLGEALRKDRARIFIQLCGVPMAANQAALFMALASEGLSAISEKKD